MYVYMISKVQKSIFLLSHQVRSTIVGHQCKCQSDASAPDSASVSDVTSVPKAQCRV